MDPGHFTAYHVGFIFSAFQRAGHADPVLFRHLAGVALRIPAPDFSLKAAANILGAFAHFTRTHFDRRRCIAGTI